MNWLINFLINFFLKLINFLLTFDDDFTFETKDDEHEITQYLVKPTQSLLSLVSGEKVNKKLIHLS